MNPTAVILYGPPASGKDTITAALTRLDARYTLFQRLKVGPDKADGYRYASADHLARLHKSRHVLYENHRYGNTYVVDEPHLTSMITTGQIPILHLGQIAGITAATRYPARWITVLLWCSRESTAERARARGSADVDARLAAWDETLIDIQATHDLDFSRRIDTDATAPDTAAAMIHAWILGAPVPPTAPGRQR
jgi:guanylate kinase